MSRTEYRYDQGNRVIEMTYPDGSRVLYERDALGRVNRVQQGNESVISNREYRASGQFSEQTFGNGLTEYRDYDIQSRLTAQRFSGSINVGDIAYHYDANGNVLSKSDQQYRYDPLNRLVNDDQMSYDYDANSNRLLNQLLNNDPAQNEAALENTTDTNLAYYSQSNQLFSINDIEIKHDATGNQLNDQQGREYHYNHNGHLSSVTEQGNLVAEYHYNALRQPVSKTVNGKITRFHYDLQGALIQESSENVVKYIWSGRQALAQQVEGQMTYLINDHLTTPRIGLDDNTVTWRWQSDGFGLSKPTGTTQINLRFPGQYADQETGLYYNWNRYYNPETGRYVTSDPIGLEAGINTYGYVGGNPMIYWDPFGLLQVSEEFSESFPRSTNRILSMDTRISNVEFSGFEMFGQASQSQVLVQLTPNNGVTIVDEILSPGVIAEFTPYVGSTEIRVNFNFLDAFESGNISGTEFDRTIKHELVHFFDDQDGIDFPGEEGLMFEEFCYGSVQ